MSDNRIFSLDEGFGNRLDVSVFQSDENAGGGFVQLFDADRDAIISIDLDVWRRIQKAVDRGIDMTFVTKEKDQ
jgi:hypothetical protein